MTGRSRPRTVTYMNTASNTDNRGTTMINTTIRTHGEVVRIRDGRIVFDGEEMGTVRADEVRDYEMFGAIRTGRFTVSTRWVVDSYGDTFTGTTLQSAIAGLVVAMKS